MAGTSFHLGNVSYMTFTLLLSCSSVFAFRPFDTYPECRLQEAVRYMGEHPQILHRSIQLMSPAVPDLQEVFTPAHDTRISPLCDGCLNVIAFVKSIIRLGVTWESVRDEVVAICKVVEAASDMDGDVICPPVMDSLGPIVYDILKRTKKNNKNICIHMNFCDPDELPSFYHEPVSPARHKIKSPAPAKTFTTGDRDIERPLAAFVGKSWVKGGKPKTSGSEGHAKRLQTALKVAHLTDIHVEEKYLAGSAGRWGAFSCNVPPRTIERFLDYVADLKPDFAIFSGDDSPHAVWTDSQERQLNSSKWVADAMGRHLHNTTIFPIMGNHENFPIDMYFLEREETRVLNSVWTDAWKRLAGFGPQQNLTLHKAGYYTTLVKPGLRILAYNSNYGSTGNFYNILNYDKPEYKEMIGWMRDTLHTARTDGEKIILISHHPYGASSSVIEFDDVITTMLADYSDVIVWHPVGHVHSDEFRLIFDRNSGEPVGVVMIAQTLNTLTNVNPGFRIFYLDPKTYEVLDYDQYYIDLVKANENDGLPVPQKLYTATEEYNLPDLSPASFLDLQKRMQNDSGLLQRYWSNQASGSGRKGDCDAMCASSQLCHIVSATHALYRECMKPTNLGDHGGGHGAAHGAAINYILGSLEPSSASTMHPWGFFGIIFGVLFGGLINWLFK